MSTNNSVADGLISTHFGAEADAIVVIRDEDPKETEANPLNKLVNVSKIIGVISCGDEKQLRLVGIDELGDNSDGFHDSLKHTHKDTGGTA